MMKKAVCVVLAILLACALVSGFSTEDAEFTVETNYGRISGTAKDGVLSYKGVPFAQPPVGELRFAPPQPMEPWEGVMDCSEFRDSPVQVASEPDISYSEDCLYLNIWLPQEAPTEPMPVLVFIHGGAYTQGSAAKATYDGTRFAKDGIIQVNISYRLNGLGFMPLEEIADEYGYFGNIGVLDQIEGLKWVKENIAYFGGDANNITISGESAGAFSVSNLIMSPLCEGLFNKAIMESGNLLGQALVAPLSNGNAEQALENTQRLMQSLDAQNLEDLRAMDAREIAEQSNFEMNMLQPSSKAFFPVFDGKILPENPYSALQNGDYNKVDILAGYNTDEGTLFVEEGISEDDYIGLVENIFGDRAGEVLERYPVDEENTPTQRARFLVKMGMRLGSDLFADALSADGQNAYLYHFNYAVPALNEAGLGTMHALELFFVFDTIPADVEVSEATQAFVEEVHTRWLNFIKSGDPNVGAELDSEWEKYTIEDKQVMVLNESSHMSAAEQVEDIAFLTSVIWDNQ